MRIFTVALVVLAFAACGGNPTFSAPVVASGDTWDLGFGPGVGHLGGKGRLCFALDDRQSGSYIFCTDLVYPEVGSGVVQSLGNEKSLVLGTVSTGVATVEVALEDGSVVATNPFVPPETITIERNLFAVEIDQPQGSAIATALDERGRSLATDEFRWTEDVGGSVGFKAL